MKQQLGTVISVPSFFHFNRVGCTLGCTYTTSAAAGHATRRPPIESVAESIVSRSRSPSRRNAEAPRPLESRHDAAARKGAFPFLALAEALRASSRRRLTQWKASANRPLGNGVVEPLSETSQGNGFSEPGGRPSQKNELEMRTKSWTPTGVRTGGPHARQEEGRGGAGGARPSRQLRPRAAPPAGRTAHRRPPIGVAHEAERIVSNRTLPSNDAPIGSARQRVSHRVWVHHRGLASPRDRTLSTFTQVVRVLAGVTRVQRA